MGQGQGFAFTCWFVFDSWAAQVGCKAINYFFISSFCMANNKFDNWLEYQQRSGGRMVVYNLGLDMHLPYVKRIIQMAQIKWALILADLLGIPFYLLGITQNIDNIRSAILFIVGLIYIMFRMYFFVIQRRQAVKDKDIDIWNKEQDMHERINKNKK